MRRRTQRKRRVRKAQNPISSSIVMINDRAQYAHIKETLVQSAHASFLPNIDIEASFNLAQYPRACAMASLFKFYRAKRVTYTYTPYFNTFQEAQGAQTQAVGKPQLYCAMNRSGDLQPFTFDQVLELGVQPIPFTKNITISYKPNWLIGGIANAAGLGSQTAVVFSSGAKVSYDWLPTVSVITDPGAPRPPGNTNQSNINTGTYLSQTQVSTYPTYQGHRLYVAQPAAPNDNYVGMEVITVEWEFKGANPGIPITQ
jgi:hypothetical protein